MRRRKEGVKAGEEEPIVELARAKVNLTLKVLGKRSDGYHELRSIVVFADFGDTLTFAPGGPLHLETVGPFAQAVDGENLVLKAARALEAAGFPLSHGALRLEKRIPVAAGLGGGSADAAACLRALFHAAGCRMGEQGLTGPCSGLTSELLVKLAAGVGADVPVCLFGKTSVMTGVGEKLTLMAGAPSLPAVLVNPGVKLSTRDVFAELNAPALIEGRLEGDDSVSPYARDDCAFPGDLPQFIECLAVSGNDLEGPARRLAPVIGEVFGALKERPGCLLARLSGSGPTCFGIFSSEVLAQSAALDIAAARPQWWTKAVMLG